MVQARALDKVMGIIIIWREPRPLLT